MDMNREQLLKELMAADFTVIDLHLYLNTHPDDCRAVMLYNAAAQRAAMLRQSFERMFGPISMGACSNCPWQWINPPWPWEKQ